MHEGVEVPFKADENPAMYSVELCWDGNKLSITYSCTKSNTLQCNVFKVNEREGFIGV